MSTKIVVNGTTVDLGVKQEDVNVAVDAKMGDLNAILNAINNGSSPANLRDVTVAIEPPDVGTVHGAGYATDGVVMSLSADLNEGYKIDHWEKNGEVITAGDRYDMTVDGNAAVTAVATNKKYVLGRDWRLVPLGDGTKQYACRRIAHGAGVYVMTVFDTDICLVSNDGITWREQALPISGKWTCISCTDGVFVMQQTMAGVNWLKSTNTTTWSQIPSPTSTHSAFSLSYSENGMMYFVASSVSDRSVYSTKDGLTWKNIEIPQIAVNWILTAKNGNRRLIIGADHATEKRYLYTDDGGETWNIGEFPDFIGSPRISVFQGKFVVLSYRTQQIFTSEDGVNWEVGSTQDTYEPSAMVSENGTLSLKHYYAKSAIMYNTVDLVNWSQYTIPNKPENLIFTAQSTSYSFPNIAMFIGLANSILVSYSTDDEPPVIPELATTANTLSLDDEEVIE